MQRGSQDGELAIVHANSQTVSSQQKYPRLAYAMLIDLGAWQDDSLNTSVCFSVSTLELGGYANPCPWELPVPHFLFVPTSQQDHHGQFLIKSGQTHTSSQVQGRHIVDNNRAALVRLYLGTFRRLVLLVRITQLCPAAHSQVLLHFTLPRSEALRN